MKNDSERQKIEDTDKKFEDIKRLFSRNEFRIEKYVINKPSQEFINNNELKTEVRAHTNKPGYSNYKPKRSISNLEKIKINNLNDVIALRLDNENYGFIHNIELDKIFYANRTTLKSIQKIIDEPLSKINKEIPQLLKALLIK